MEFIRHALSYLQAAKKLNTLMSEQRWPSNYYRGQVVLMLAFHSVELFLKGFILKLDSNAQVNGHSLARLTKILRRLAPDISFDPPFKVEALVPYPESVRRAEKDEARFHEVLRYPIDKEGNPWPGVRGFSASLCRRFLAKVESDCEQIYTRIFESAG